MKTIQFRTHHFHDVWQCINKRLLLVGSLLIVSPYLLLAEAPKSPRGGEFSQVQSVKQDKTVKGKILDEKGEILIGVTVKVAGTPDGTITDFEGNFSLKVAENATLEISYVGYKTQKISIANQTDFVITMEPDNQVMNEVVVVGYGSMKQKNVTGSITTISAKDLEDLPVATITEALQGEINGLHIELGSPRPGGGIVNQVYIRQARSLNGLGKDSPNNNPLVIIDDVMQLTEKGYPDLSALNTLDPSEVESITVLRDASAAIYGSRAANGAILIKTKRGKSGVPRITYSGKFALNDAVSHSKVLKGSDYGRFYNSVVRNAGKVKAEEIDKFFSEEEIIAMDDLHYDWLDKANWKAAFQQTHTLNVSGGTERATYYAGVSYFDQSANLSKQDYRRMTYRAGLDIKLTSDVKLSASISGNESKKNTIWTKGARFKMYGGSSSSPTADYNVLHHMPDYIPWSITLKNENGEEEEVWLGPYTAPYSKIANPKKSSVSSWNYFGLTENDSYTTDEQDGWTANISLTYEVPFIKGLSLRANYSTSHNSIDSQQFAFPYEIAYINKQPVVGQHLPNNIPLENYSTKIFKDDAQVNFQGSLSQNRQINFYVNYDRDFGQHHIAAMFSIERSEAKSKSHVLTYRDNIPDDFHDIFTGDSRDGSMKDFLAKDMANKAKNRSGALSYLGRISYSYADRYMLQFLFRTDASVKFAPENYWGFFPSVSAGWVTSEENWFKEKLPWFEFLKVRVSWGLTGRDDVKGNWQWKQTYTTQNNPGSQFGPNGGISSSGLLPGVASPNRNLKWSKSHKMNLGFDMTFLRGRLSATWDMYYDINDDIINAKLAEQPGIPVYAGGSYAQQNFGRIDNYGTELSLHWRDKIGEVSYSIGMNFGLDGNKVRKWIPGLNKNKYPSNTSDLEEGGSTYRATWGFLTWKGTSKGDGIIRTEADRDAYWNYLTDLATAAGTIPKYLGKSTKEEIPLGALAYQDLGGEMKDNVQQGPNGQINKEQDWAQLCGKHDDHEFSTKLGIRWKDLTVNANLSTSWGGVRMIDRKKMDVKSDATLVWSPDAFWKDMFDPETNPDGIYPNYGVETKLGGSVFENSDFWKLNTFRCYIRNLTIAYSLPKAWVAPLKMQSVRLNLTGNNLFDLYNPYPNHYRNMYNDGATDYPSLRTWSFGINVSF